MSAPRDLEFKLRRIVKEAVREVLAERKAEQWHEGENHKATALAAPTETASDGGSLFRGTNHEFVQSNECERHRARACPPGSLARHDVPVVRVNYVGKHRLPALPDHGCRLQPKRGGEMIITDQQHDAMLHALGYFQYERNYYVASVGSEAHAEWMELARAGLAERRPYNLDERSASDLFKVTEAGIAVAVKRSIERSGAAEPRARP